MTAGLRPILEAILPGYSLPRTGFHGVAHWARVLENGLRLAEQTSADAEVVALFAVFHDSRRLNESVDPGHGRRGAELAEQLRGSVFQLPDDRFRLLHEACCGHTDLPTHDDVTVRTCFDSDRLDLGRVGIRPDPRLLATDAARHPEMLNWADGRACLQVVPDLVLDEWGIVLSRSDQA